MKRCASCSNWLKPKRKKELGQCLNRYAILGWKIRADLDDDERASSELLTHRLFGCVLHKEKERGLK